MQGVMWTGDDKLVSRGDRKYGIHSRDLHTLFYLFFKIYLYYKEIFIKY